MKVTISIVQTPTPPQYAAEVTYDFDDVSYKPKWVGGVVASVTNSVEHIIAAMTRHVLPEDEEPDVSRETSTDPWDVPDATATPDDGWPWPLATEAPVPTEAPKTEYVEPGDEDYDEATADPEPDPEPDTDPQPDEAGYPEEDPRAR